MKTKNLLLALIAIIGFATTTTAQSIPAYIPTDGLIGWWPFNGNPNDESGNNNNGTSNGAVLTTDRFGNDTSAYLFNGTSSYISIPTSASLESPTTGFSVTAWVNLAGYSLIGQAFDPILTKSDNSGNAFMYRFDIDINGTGYYAGTNVWTSNIGAAYNFKLNQWYLLSAVLDSFTAYIYLNDTLVATQPYTTNIQNNTLPLEIGRDVPGITEVFNGKIDDVALWNKALTKQQITNVYNGTATGIKHPEAENKLKIYPNPATNQMTVCADNFVVGSNYTISDAMGRTVLTGKLSSPNTIVPLSNLPTGIYMLRAGGKVKQTFNILKL